MRPCLTRPQLNKSNSGTTSLAHLNERKSCNSKGRAQRDLLFVAWLPVHDTLLFVKELHRTETRFPPEVKSSNKVKYGYSYNSKVQSTAP